MYTPPALCMAELSSLNQTLPAVPGVSPPPLPAPSHLGAQLGTSGHSVALEPSISTAGYHGRGAGQPPPPGDELQSNKARWSQRQRFMPAINQEAQTALFPAGLAQREAGVGAQGSWGLWGVLLRVGVLGTFVPACPKLLSKDSNHKVKPQSCQEELGRFGSWVQGRFWQRCCRCCFAICSLV